MTNSTFSQSPYDVHAPVQQEHLELQPVGKMTVLEALAEETSAISPNRSNISTRVKDADPDDQ